MSNIPAVTKAPVETREGNPLPKYGFLCGFPQSGVTILSAILRQNPHMYVGPQSPLPEIITGMSKAYAGSANRKAHLQSTLSKAQLYHAQHAAIQAWYSPVRQIHSLGDETEALEWCFDKETKWITLYPLLKKLSQEEQPPVLLVVVRDIRTVLAEMEILHRSRLDISVGSGAGLNTESRVAQWLDPDKSELGQDLSRLKASLVDKTALDFKFIKYEHLTRQPLVAMLDVYKKLGYRGNTAYKHDFSDLPVEGRTHSEVHNIFTQNNYPGGSLKPSTVDFEETLGAGVGDLVIQQEPWFYETFYPEVLAGMQAGDGMPSKRSNTDQTKL